MYWKTLQLFGLACCLPVILEGQDAPVGNGVDACSVAVVQDPAFDLSFQSDSTNRQIARFADSLTIWSPIRPMYESGGYYHEQPPVYRRGVGGGKTPVSVPYDADSVYGAITLAVREFAQGKMLNDSALAVGLLRFAASGSYWGASSTRQQEIVLRILQRLELGRYAWVLVGSLSGDIGLRERAHTLAGASPTQESNGFRFRSAFRSVCQVLLVYRAFEGVADAADVLPVHWSDFFHSLIAWLNWNWSGLAEEELGCTRATCFSSFDAPSELAKQTEFVWRRREE